jgi:hypothetical protein
VALDAATWLGIGGLEYAEPVAETVAHTRSVVSDARVDTVGPQNSGQALLALGYALLASGDPAVLDEAAAAAAQAAVMLSDSGVQAAVPQCEVLGLTVSRAKGLDPSAAAGEAARIAARLDRQAVDVSMRPPTVLATLWEALSGAGRDYEEERARLRAMAQAYVDRRLAGTEDDATERGFLAVPSVARLVDVVGLSRAH